MPQRKSDKSKLLPVEISILTGKDHKAPDVRVYLFDAAGRLEHSVKAKQRTELRIHPQQRYRVTVGPDLLVEGKPPPADLAMRLVKAGAISQDYLPQNPIPKVSISIHEALSALWLFVCMNIHGTVRKLLNPGGTPPTYAPICT